MEIEQLAVERPDALAKVPVNALTGVDAVDVANEFKPRVVLMDIGLPTLNGFEAAKRIRATAWGKQAVLIAVTGWGETVDREHSKQAGFDHHLVKPVDPDMLTNLLASL
jgi:CheY-like chemotaxis protein